MSETKITVTVDSSVPRRLKKILNDKEWEFRSSVLIKDENTFYKRAIEDALAILEGRYKCTKE